MAVESKACFSSPPASLYGVGAGRAVRYVVPSGNVMVTLVAPKISADM